MITLGESEGVNAIRTVRLGTNLHNVTFTQLVRPLYL